MIPRLMGCIFFTAFLLKSTPRIDLSECLMHWLMA